MDSRGEHASQCKHGFGLVHRHDRVRNTLMRHVFRTADLVCQLEVLFLIQNTERRPADILVMPGPPSPVKLIDKSTAYDITVRSL